MDVVAGRDVLGREADNLTVAAHLAATRDGTDGDLVPRRDHLRNANLAAAGPQDCLWYERLLGDDHSVIGVEKNGHIVQGDRLRWRPAEQSHSLPGSSWWLDRGHARSSIVAIEPAAPRCSDHSIVTAQVLTIVGESETPSARELPRDDDDIRVGNGVAGPHRGPRRACQTLQLEVADALQRNVAKELCQLADPLR